MEEPGSSDAQGTLCTGPPSTAIHFTVSCPFQRGQVRPKHTVGDSNGGEEPRYVSRPGPTPRDSLAGLKRTRPLQTRCPRRPPSLGHPAPGTLEETGKGSGRRPYQPPPPLPRVPQTPPLGQTPQSQPCPPPRPGPPRPRPGRRPGPSAQPGVRAPAARPPARAPPSRPVRRPPPLPSPSLPTSPPTPQARYPTACSGS